MKPVAHMHVAAQLDCSPSVLCESVFLDCAVQAQMEAAKEALFAANIGVGSDLSNLLSEDNPDGVVMITEDGKITFVNKVLTCARAY